jgi:hypothetical protein
MKYITGFAAYLSPPILAYLLLEGFLPKEWTALICFVYFLIHCRYMLKFFDNKKTN